MDERLRAQWQARRGHFADDARISRSRAIRWLWIVAGTIAFGLGSVGVFVPVLPTTPFMLLAAACYFRSSARLYDRVLSNRVFGPLVYEWRERRTMPLHAKVVAIVLVVLTIGTSVAFFIPAYVAQVVVASIGVLLVIWLAAIPTYR